MPARMTWVLAACSVAQHSKPRPAKHAARRHPLVQARSPPAMKAMPTPTPGHGCNWAELMGLDCFDGVLDALLEDPQEGPGAVAACRLVCRAWRGQVGSLLKRLAPPAAAAGAAPPDVAAIAAAFPSLRDLTLDVPSPGPLPALGGAAALLRLRRLAVLRWGLGPEADCGALLAPLPGLRALELSGLRLQGTGPALLRLPALRSLALERCSFGADGATLPAQLVALTGLESLSLHGYYAPGAALRLVGVPALSRLTRLRLGVGVAVGDDTCREVAALPRLRDLHLTR